MSRYADDVAFAHVLADTADRITVARFKARDLRVGTKPDMTPVTDADTAVETPVSSSQSAPVPTQPSEAPAAPPKRARAFWQAAASSGRTSRRPSRPRE